MARWVSFLNRVSHNEVGSNQNNVPANKSSLLLLLLVHSIHFQVFDKKVHFRIVPAAAKLIVSRLDKELV